MGFAWTVFAWLLAVDHLPGPGEASGRLRRVYETVAYFGPIAALGALTFVAYLVGVLTTLKPNSFFSFAFSAGRHVLVIYRWPIFRDTIDRTIGDLREVRELGFRVFSEPMMMNESVDAILHRLQTQSVPIAKILAHLPRTQKKFDELLGERGERPATRASDSYFWEWVQSDAGRKFVAHDVADDLPTVATRLLIREKELFDKFDRDSTESEFRLGLMVPLAAITFVLVIQSGWFTAGWDLFAALVSAYLVLGAFLFRGLAKQKEANDVLLDALAEGLVTAPTVDALDQLSNVRKRRFPGLWRRERTDGA